MKVDEFGVFCASAVTCSREPVSFGRLLYAVSLSLSLSLSVLPTDTSDRQRQRRPYFGRFCASTITCPHKLQSPAVRPDSLCSPASLVPSGKCSVDRRIWKSGNRNSCRILQHSFLFLSKTRVLRARPCQSKINAKAVKKQDFYVRPLLCPDRSWVSTSHPSKWALENVPMSKAAGVWSWPLFPI
jgi:hypothetical protein